MSFFTLLSSAEVAVVMGLIYSVMGMGYYLSYTILDFPDLTVEGSVVSGAVSFGLLVRAGLDPWLSLLCAFLIGCAAGAVTGVLHVKLKIRDLLCGILVSTFLISVNLILTVVGQGGKWDGSGALTVIPVRQTVFSTKIASWIPANIQNIKLRELVVCLVVAAAIKLLLDWFLKTKCGLLLRAAGNNPRFVTMLGRDPGHSKILGLALGNGLAAVTGALLCCQRSSADQSMGLGMVVIGIASVIIGMSVFGRVRFMKPTTKVILGAVIYQLALGVATLVGIPSGYNKALMACLFTVALVTSDRLRKKRGGAA